MSIRKYLICKSVKNIKNEALSVHNDKYNAIFELESISVDYVYHKDEVQRSVIPVDIKKFEDPVYKNAAQVGHYIVKYPLESLYKTAIWRKRDITKKAVTKGIFGWSSTTTTTTYEWELVFTLDIISLPNILLPSEFDFDDSCEKLNFRVRHPISVILNEWNQFKELQTTSYKTLSKGEEKSKLTVPPPPPIPPILFKSPTSSISETIKPDISKIPMPTTGTSGISVTPDTLKKNVSCIKNTNCGSTCDS
jgi:hypothetical protein